MLGLYMEIQGSFGGIRLRAGLKWANEISIQLSSSFSHMDFSFPRAIPLRLEIMEIVNVVLLDPSDL